MESKKRLIITSVISILLVSILLIGSTYSLFTSESIDEDMNVYHTGNLDVTYTLSSDNVTLNNNLPTSLEDVNRLPPYRITITNKGNVPYMFNVILLDTTAGEPINYQYLYTKVGWLEPKTLDSTTTASVTIDGNNYTGRIIKESVVIPPKISSDVVVNIDVRIWISDTVQNTEIGKSFYGRLLIDGQAVYDYNKEIDNSILEFPLIEAKNLNYDNNNTEEDCSSSQCMIDKINDLIGG